MTRIAPLALLFSVSLGCHLFPEPEFEGSFQVPPGFVVEIAASPEMTGSLIQMTFDSLGRPVVSKEQGHPVILFDNDDDGLYETEKVFTDKVQNLQGMWFDGRTLYAVGDDSAEEKAGLYRLEDTNGDDVADTFETLTLFTGPMGEHGPHDIRRGPDGHPSVLIGNHSGVPADLIDPSSPLRGYKESQLLPRYMDARGHAVDIWAPGGALFRLNLDRMRYSLLLGGFRNPYNHAYNWDGEAFTYDSDMEWDINLPWYREVRSVHAVLGADYGWRTGSGKFPDYYIDTLPPVDDLGRGSPVGVEFYHHYVYPEEYFDAFLQGDWSRGRVVFAKYERDGASYKLARDAFDFIYGEPLNVTDLEVGPDGYVYFTMGGRGTVGGFYRVAYRGYNSNSEQHQQQQGVMAAIRQPQPLSSWGHAALLRMKEEMGESWGAELERVARDTSAASRDRVQALMHLQRLAPRPNADLLRPLSQDPDPAVRAAAVYVVGQHGSGRAKAIAAGALKDSDPFVRRRAAEAVVRMGLTADQPSFAPIDDVYALLNDSDRFVRYAGRLALERTPRSEWEGRVLQETNPLGALEGMLALVRTNPPGGAGLDPLFEKQLAFFKQGLGAENELRLLRTFHLTCLEIETGCRPELRRLVYDLIAPRFPAEDERLNREYARTMAYAGAPEAVEKILAAMPKGEENQQLQIHYVYCLRAIEQGWSSEQKKNLLAWFGKAKQWRGGASFPGFINRLFDSSLEFFDESEKKMAYNAIPEFAPLTESEMDSTRRRRGNYVPAAVFARQRGVSGVSEQEIFEYMMYDPMTLRADASDGREVYEKECSKCHRFGGMGKDFGPELTTVANRFTRKDLIEAVLYPSKAISDQYEGYIVETKGGEIFLGMIQSEDDEKIVMLIADEERPVVIAKSDVSSKRVSEVSTMPTQLLDGYSMRDISNLFAFLQKAPQ